MKRIKVLQIAAVDITVKYLLSALIDGLSEEGYDVQIICSDGKYVGELRRKGYAIEPVKIDRKIAPVLNLKSLIAIYRYIRGEKFDIVHVHSPVAAVLGRIAARMAGVPVIIYTAHGFYFHENMRWWKRCIMIWIERIVQKTCCDMLLTQSREDRETAIAESIVDREEVLWISNGVDTDKFAPGKIKVGLRDSFGLSTSDRVIGFTGRLVREKGMEELLLAVKKLKEDIPGIKLLVVGDTLESDRDQKAGQCLRKIISDNALENDIIFAGFREDMPDIYGIMDVFVLPSYREGMPRSILEAMASGKPVVATNIRGSREEVVDGVTGRIVPVKDSGALAAAIKEILINKELADKMSNWGRKRSASEFDERMVINRELKVYRELIDDKINSKNT
ncbi:MAG: glycosyltransferase family 4 protein [Candidatus Omnitrophica bacterium]|nr:glycosyltransferase family 4 protein [Candidatus Omnitrophota bacterium]